MPTSSRSASARARKESTLCKHLEKLLGPTPTGGDGWDPPRPNLFKIKGLSDRLSIEAIELLADYLQQWLLGLDRLVGHTDGRLARKAANELRAHRLVAFNPDSDIALLDSNEVVMFLYYEVGRPSEEADHNA